MNFTEAVTTAFQNYFNFKTRSRRSEYWYFSLFLLLLGIATGLVDQLVFSTETTDIGPLNGIASLATLIPSFAVSVRRLHDIERSGWFLLLALIPIIGWIILLYWMCQPGTPGQNQFGEDPMGEGGLAV